MKNEGLEWWEIEAYNNYIIKLRESRKKAVMLNDALKKKYKDKLQFKCVADDIWLYCQYLYDNIDYLVELRGHKITEENKNEFYKRLQDIYKNIRGENFYIGKKPSAIGGAVFYITSLLEGVPTSQKNIAKFISVSELGVRNAGKLLTKELYKR